MNKLPQNKDIMFEIVWYGILYLVFILLGAKMWEALFVILVLSELGDIKNK